MFPGFPNIMMGSGVQGFIPSDHFKAITYTGDGSSSRAITGVGFEPGFIWAKRRDALASHAVFDVIRGPTKRLRTDTNGAEVTQNGVLSFDADGFTAGDNGAVNPSGGAMVAWCLKAGGAGATNTDGSITSTVSANVDAGFSVVTYTGTLSNDTIGHGLNSAPELVMCKTLDAVNQWHCGHTALGWNSHIHLDLTNKASSSSTAWNTTAPDNSVVNLGTSSGSNNSGPMVAYCFHSVPGFSKVGSYTGDGGTNNYVELGFRPAFVMFKRTDSVDNWIILDNVRDTANPRETRLFPNLNLADNVNPSVDVDFSDNGFTLTNTDGAINASGGTYIYLAFAA